MSPAFTTCQDSVLSLIKQSHHHHIQLFLPNQVALKYLCCPLCLYFQSECSPFLKQYDAEVNVSILKYCLEFKCVNSNGGWLSEAANSS